MTFYYKNTVKHLNFRSLIILLLY